MRSGLGTYSFRFADRVLPTARQNWIHLSPVEDVAVKLHPGNSFTGLLVSSAYAVTFLALGRFHPEQTCRVLRDDRIASPK